jgi:hypothetical protein
MSPPQTMTLDFKRGHEPSTQADFTYSITPDTISITDTGKGRVSVANDIEAVLRKIEYWHQGSIARFKIMYRDEHGVWDGVRWSGQHSSFLALGRGMRGRRWRSREGWSLNKAIDPAKGSAMMRAR